MILIWKCIRRILYMCILYKGCCINIIFRFYEVHCFFWKVLWASVSRIHESGSCILRLYALLYASPWRTVEALLLMAGFVPLTGWYGWETGSAILKKSQIFMHLHPWYVWWENSVTYVFQSVSKIKVQNLTVETLNSCFLDTACTENI